MAELPQSAEFLALWSKHSKQIYAYIYSLVFNGPDADDVFQETSLILLQKFDEFEPGTNFTAWACRVAYLKVLKLLEHRHAPEFLDERLLEVLDQETHHSADDLDARIAALTQCLTRLNPRDRELITQRYEVGSTIDSLARKIGRSSSLVYKSLARIHDSLLECVRRRLAEGDGP